MSGPSRPSDCEHHKPNIKRGACESAQIVTWPDDNDKPPRLVGSKVGLGEAHFSGLICSQNNCVYNRYCPWKELRK